MKQSKALSFADGRGRFTPKAGLGQSAGSRRIASLAAAVGLVASCGRGGTVDDEVDRESSAIVSTASLELKVLTSTCVANQVFDTFQIKNSGSAPVKFSDIKIKLWANDTTGQNVVPHVWTAGCATGANGDPSCVHQVTGMSGASTSFAPACGPDANHLANWEITLSSTDSNTLAAGATWNNLQTGYNLANYANFSPGAGTWYSGCVGATSVADPHFAIYYQGNLVYSNGLTAPDCRAPKGSRPLTGFRTPAIAAAPFVRPVPESQAITFSLSLPVRNPAGQPTLADLASQVSDPASSLYRQYLTQDQFTNLYAPTATDYQAIVSWAQSVGLTVKTFPSRMVVGVSGPASVLKKAFYMNLNFYQRPDGSVFYAPDREPSIDLNAPLVQVGALDNYFARRPAAMVVTDWGSNRLLMNGYGLGDGAFGYGEGECVGLFADDGFSLADPTALMKGKTVYTRNPALAKPTFRAVLLNPKFVAGQPAPLGCSDGSLCGPKPNCPMGSPNCCMMPDPAMPGSFKLESACDAVCANDAGTATTGSACPSGPTLPASEIAADIDMAMALASGLKEVVVYEGGSTDSALAAMASDPAKCKQLSSSWFLGIEPRTVELLQQLIVQGQALSVASGDTGAVGEQGSIARLPYVTAVGGTVLTGTAQDATPDVFEYTSEAPWPNSGSFIADGTRLPPVPIPGYQQGMNMTFCPSGMFCNGSVQYRNVPDIAMVSSKVQFSFRGGLPDANGTSLSSPLWAGWLAVANAYAKKNNLPSIGFPNPALYAIGKTRGTAADIYKDTFHDVVGGTTSVFTPPCRPGNDCGPPSVASPAWPAVAGYDLASGWGSPTPKLIQALTTGLPPANPIVDIASGWAHTCALKADKTVACWGENTLGQLGSGSVATNSPAPLVVPGVSGIGSVSAGFTFSCALEPLPSGKVYCWGSNDCAVLGTGDTTISYRMAPAQVMGLPLPAVAVTGGISHACALLTDNSVYCWGCNFSGQLGNNGPPGQDALTPIKVASLSNVSAITAGQFHTCAIASGAPWCWGNNSDGELGDGTTTSVQRVPVRAAPALTFDASNFVSYLSAGNGTGDHTCMVVHHAGAHDDLLCWGLDHASQLGDNGLVASQGTDHTPTPLLVQPIDANPLTVWSSPLPGGALASGNALTCVIRSADHDATECWGKINAVAGPAQTLMTRTEVASLAGVKVSKVVAGFGHACVLLGSGEVRCWGQNDAGQVGDGVGVPFWSEPHKVNF